MGFYHATGEVLPVIICPFPGGLPVTRARW
jgi:hypothetical protein